MPGINYSWDEVINESDGRYLTDTELQKFQQYVQTFTVRSKTYEILREKSEPLIKHALKKFMLTYPDVMEKHSQRCLYDMRMAVCIIGLSILRDDLRFFKETLFLWQANILGAYQRNQSCHKAYECLQEVFKEYLPPACNQLLKPYVDVMLQSLDTHPKLMANVERGGMR